MGTRKLYFEAARVGDELPLRTAAPIDRVTIARYVGAVGDFNPYYVDEDYAKRCGFPTVCVPGSYATDFLGQLASAWLRPGQIKRITARFVKMVWPGDQLVGRARILDKRREGGEYYVDLEIWAENQRGECVVKGSLSSKVYHSPEDEDRQRRGLSPLIVDEERPPSLVEVFEREMPLEAPNTLRSLTGLAESETFPPPGENFIKTSSQRRATKDV